MALDSTEEEKKNIQANKDTDSIHSSIQLYNQQMDEGNLILKFWFVPHLINNMSGVRRSTLSHNNKETPLHH